MAAGRPITVTIGEMGERAAARVASGRYASMSEVVRAGLCALDREQAAIKRRATIAHTVAE